MHPKRAVQGLTKLREDAGTPEVRREGPANESWKAKVDAVMAAALGKDSETLRRFRDVRYHVGLWTGAPGEAEQDARFFADWVDDAAGLIDAAIYQLELEADPEEEPSPMPARRVPTGPIFVVHGQDEARKQALMRLLEKAVDGAQPIVLHEQVSGGATSILDKFERHAQTASCAVVLLTGDDEGRLRGGDPLKPRGRQNVILELGVFIGLPGRAHVVILKDPDVEVPSDLDGLIYVPLDSAGAWQPRLLKELAGMGITTDANRIP